jgi:hypothetical protein
MNVAYELTIERSPIFTDDIFTVNINNRVPWPADATGQENQFVVTLDEPSDEELTTAARQVFSYLDREEGNAASR